MPSYFKCHKCGKEKLCFSEELNCCQAIPMFCADCSRDIHDMFPSAIFDRVVAPDEYIDVESTEIDLEKLLKGGEYDE